ncbi:T9SS type A sorting domain-containing protein [Aequorivita sp. F47161]|uniref:T9SS type A sorting domain-containing protein n=1 Tax=Aequorivita vitellina TaxID=2874475 RepID=A0A9X1QYJ9_9FLAO|nr:T9SS type A sorting domain-containing protein [Aequorivita vitellina]MCG2419722.1 T9SS type A sorting domain-containing protein [Aequorivita vitellina]
MKSIITLFALFGVTLLHAQWTTDTDANTLVAESGELDVMARGTSDGQTYVVFWKNVGPPTNIELRLQIMDADGNQTLGSDGMLVSDQIPMSSSTVIMTSTVDDNDNLYIGATGTAGGDPAFVFKLDTDGNHLWGTNGVQVGSGNVVTVLPLSAGGAIVSWLSGSGAVMQKYDDNGVVVWPATKPLTTGSGAAAPGNFFEVSGGEYIAVFHKLLTGINSFLYAQRYDADGNPVWGNAVQISDRATAFIRSYKGVQDGDVVYMGYFASAGTRFDSYLQRINPDGTLPWGVNGSDFDTRETDYEMETEIAFEAGSQFIWSVATYSNTSQSEKGEYVQKFDKDSGARQLTDNAKVVFPIASEKIHAGSLQLINNTPLFIIKEGIDNGVSPVTLHSVYLDENGDFAWSEETRPVATFMASKGRINFTENAASQSVAVFTEDKGDGQKIYAQNVADDTAGVEDFSDVSISFANPVKAEMIIKSNSPIEAISIYNVLGQQLYSAKYNGDTSISVNTQNLTTGIYFMNVSSKEGTQKGIKLVKQ